MSSGKSTQSAIIVSSTSNVAPASQPHVLRKVFPLPYNSRNDRIALANLTMPYAFFNITTAFVNTGGCNYVWIDGVTYPVLYQPGSYEISDLSNYLQNQMALNGHYLVDDNGKNVYYLSFDANPNYYAVELQCSAVPTVLPTGWTNPHAVPLNGKVPQLMINGGSNTWGRLIGFLPGYYPATLSTVPSQFLSNSTPTISPTTVINISCDWVHDGRFDNNSSIIGSFVPTGVLGDTITYQPLNLIYLPVSQNQWAGITLSFLDQNFQPLGLVDTSQIQFTLLLESSSDAR